MNQEPAKPVGVCAIEMTHNGLSYRFEAPTVEEAIRLFQNHNKPLHERLPFEFASCGSGSGSGSRGISDIYDIEVELRSVGDIVKQANAVAFGEAFAVEPTPVPHSEPDLGANIPSPRPFTPVVGSDIGSPFCSCYPGPCKCEMPLCVSVPFSLGDWVRLKDGKIQMKIVGIDYHRDDAGNQVLSADCLSDYQGPDQCRHRIPVDRLELAPLLL